MDDLNSIKLTGGFAFPSNVRRIVVLTAALTVGLSFLVATGLLIKDALHERHVLAHRGLSVSVTAADLLDREVQGLGNLLKGLSRSPHLQTNDLEAFDAQLKATPHPEGASFILWDLEGQLLNTKRPFGSQLPRIVELPATVKERFPVVRRERLSLSDRVDNPVVQRQTVSVSLRLDDEFGEMSRILSLVLPDDHLSKAAENGEATSGWRTFIVDRNLQEMTGPAEPRQAPVVQGMRELRDALSGPEREGHFEIGTGPNRLLVTYCRSRVSGYTAVSVAPAAMLKAPIERAVYRIAMAGALLFAVGGASASLLVRNGGPLDTMRRDAATTRGELAAANARMSSILESVSDCYFTLDRAYTIVDVNAAAMRWWGHERRKVVGQSYFDIVGHDPAFDAALAQAMHHRRQFQGALASIYHPGRYIDYRVYPSPEGASVFFSDVTDRYEAHRAAVREREFLQASLDALSAHVAILDDRGIVLSVNGAWHRYAQHNGSPESPGPGMSYLAACDAARHEGVAQERIFRGMEALVAGRQSSFQALYRSRSSDDEGWFLLRASRFSAAEEARIIVAREDVTEIMAARAEVSEMSERLLTLQEEERRRIAAELHNSTAQHLVAVGLSLMQVGALGLPPAGQRILDEIDRSLEEALKELRIFTYLLHPPGLETDGLAATIRAFADGFADRSGLAVATRLADETEQLSPELQRALFRIVQEGLANVHRHAGAKNVTVSLRITPTEVILSIGDDGKGMRGRRSGSGARTTLGVGIPGMRIRLSQFGGNLRIRSNRRGTVVRAAAPRDADSIAGKDYTSAQTS